MSGPRFPYTFGAANPTPADLARGIEELARELDRAEYRARLRDERALVFMGSIGAILGAIVVATGLGTSGEWWRAVVAGTLMLFGLYLLWASSRIEVEPPRRDPSPSLGLAPPVPDPPTQAELDTAAMAANMDTAPITRPATLPRRDPGATRRPPPEPVRDQRVELRHRGDTDG